MLSRKVSRRGKMLGGGNRTDEELTQLVKTNTLIALLNEVWSYILGTMMGGRETNKVVHVMFHTRQ